MNRTERATDRGGSPSLPGWSYETIRNVTALLPDVRRLVLGSTVSALGNGLVLPLTLIYLHRVRHIVLPTTGLLLAVPGVVGLVAVPLAGIAMDRFGARRVLAVALLLTAGAQFAFGFADSPAWFVPVLFVQGFRARTELCCVEHRARRTDNRARTAARVRSTWADRVRGARLRAAGVRQRRRQSVGVVALSLSVNTLTIVLVQLPVLRLLRTRRRTSALAMVGLIWCGSWILFSLCALPTSHTARDAIVHTFAALFGLGETFLAPSIAPLVNALAPEHVRGRANCTEQRHVLARVHKLASHLCGIHCRCAIRRGSACSPADASRSASLPFAWVGACLLRRTSRTSATPRISNRFQQPESVTPPRPPPIFLLAKEFHAPAVDLALRGDSFQGWLAARDTLVAVGADDVSSGSGSLWSGAFASASLDSMHVYDSIVARMFTPWAHDLINRLAPSPGCAALDVACGPGTVSLVLAKCIGLHGHVVATDVSPAMLEIARSKPTDAASATIEWIEAPATPLPLPDFAFDIVTCQQGLQFFPDKVGALAEMRRVLRPGGRLGVAVWTRVEDQVFGYLRDAIANVVSVETAERYLGPFLLTGEDAADFARRAGFENISLERVTLPAILLGGVEELFDTLPASGIASAIGELDNAKREELLAEIARLADPARDGASLRGSLTASVLVLS